MFSFLIVFVVLFWTLYVHWDGRRIRDVSKHFQNDIPMTILGHAHLFIGSNEVRMKSLQTLGRQAIKHNGVSKFWVLNKLILVIADPETIEVVSKVCLEKDKYTMKYLVDIVGNGSLIAPVNIWRPRRKIMATNFNPKNLNSFMQIFVEQSAVMVDRLKPAAGCGDFSIWKYVTTYAFDAVCETTLGMRNESQKSYNLFISTFDELCQMITHRIVTLWLHPDLLYRLLGYQSRVEECKKILCDFVDEFIHQKRHAIDQFDEKQHNKSLETSKPVKTILDMLIEMSGGNDGYTNLELREEVTVLLMAGTDTSSVGISFTIVLLSRYPEVQEKVYKELQEVFGDSDRPIVSKDLPKLKYLEAVLKESLRLYPPAPVVVREVNKDVQLPSGPTIVDGVTVLISIWGMHRNPRFWGDDAEQFRPERFFEGPLKHPAQFIPFSYGARNCVGYQYAMMSMKTVVATLLRRYRVLPPENMDATQLREPLEVKFDIMMKHVDNFTVRLECRNN